MFKHIIYRILNQTDHLLIWYAGKEEVEIYLFSEIEINQAPLTRLPMKSQLTDLYEKL
jgi:hypothetical protein